MQSAFHSLLKQEDILTRLIFQIFQVFVYIIVIPCYIWSSATKTPLVEILGETGCLAINALYLCRGLKIVLGGVSMSVFR